MTSWVRVGHAEKKRKEEAGVVERGKKLSLAEGVSGSSEKRQLPRQGKN